MGLFSSKKKIYVSSVIYGMAGPEEDRPNYLKTLVTGHFVAGDPKRYISDVLSEGYQAGPRFQLRSFYRWAQNNYNYIGMPNSSMSGSAFVDNDILATQIPHGTGEDVVIQQSDVERGEIFYWGLQYVLRFMPQRVGEAWVADYNPATGQASVTFPDSSYTFTPSGYDPDGVYICAQYMLSSTTSGGPEEADFVVNLAPGVPFTDVSAWTQDGVTNTPKSATLNKSVRTIVTYSDGRPSTDNTVPSSTVGNWNEKLTKAHHRTTIIDDGLSKLVDQRIEQYETKAVSPRNTDRTTQETVGGVTITTRVITTEDILEERRTEQLFNTPLSGEVFGPNTVFIYRVGSGNVVLDNMFVTQTSVGQYFPFIPIRLDNKFLSDSYEPTAYALAKKAYKKAFKSDFDELIDQLKDNPSLGDIDYAYVAFGVPANIKDNSAKKYMFKFLDKLRAEQVVDPGAYASWASSQNSYEYQKKQWLVWFLSGRIGPEPVVGAPLTPPINEVTIASNGSLNTNFNMVMAWEEIRATNGTGLGRPGAMSGDVWWNVGPTDEYDYSNWNGSGGETVETYLVDNITITMQLTTNTWRRLTIFGLVHRNYIYDGKFVEIGLKDALMDPDESGFLFPLHYPTMGEMSVVDSTQLCMSASNLVFNCFQIVKKKWYQRGIFKVILVIAVVVLTIVTGGAGAASVGLLGTNLAVGTALGMVGLAAIIAGAIANALAAMIVMKLFTLATVAIFGEEIAMIINFIASVYTMAVGGLTNIGQSLSGMWGNMMNASNLLTLTNSVGNIYANYVNNSAMEIQKQTAEMIADYTKQAKEIAAKEREILGGGTGFDPLALIGAPSFFTESIDSFLTRTLLTGHDVAEISHAMLDNFVEMSLSTPIQ